MTEKEMPVRIRRPAGRDSTGNPLTGDSNVELDPLTAPWSLLPLGQFLPSSYFVRHSFTQCDLLFEWPLHPHP